MPGRCPTRISLFDRHTAVYPLGEGRFAARLDRAWWILRGPNGGYLAAILVRAMQGAVADPARGLRSLTVHYLRPPAEGEVEIQTRVERQGRSLTTVSARMQQGRETQALALAAFSRPRPGDELHHAVMPEVPAPERIAARSANPDVPIHSLYDERPVLGGGPWGDSRGSEALSGGWIRLAEPHPLDDALIAAYSDAWPPAIFACSDVKAGRGVPTVDLTVHVRAGAAHPRVAPDDFVLAVFRTRECREGFLEEDGELWSRDGVLLAQSRQLAVMG